MPEEALRRYLESFWEVVGTGDLIDRWAPSRAGETWFRESWGRGERLSGGRRYLAQIVELFLRTDVRGVLGAIQAPTLVLRRRDDPHVRVGHAQYLVDHIPDARLVELPGSDHEWFSGNTDDVLDAIEEFLTGRRTAIATNRVLATVLFTDIVGSTERAASLGDAEWARVLDAHDALVERTITMHRGQIVKSTGDGVLATFDGPARAIECASALVSGVATLGLEIRAGLHTGEIELEGDDIRGIGVHIAARIMALAGAGEVFVSGSIPPLVLGSGLQFEDLGARTLKGVPEPWPVFRLGGADQADQAGQAG
jgi:class 3 adenylate cyclase